MTRSTTTKTHKTTRLRVCGHATTETDSNVQRLSGFTLSEVANPLSSSSIMNALVAGGKYRQAANRKELMKTG